MGYRDEDGTARDRKGALVVMRWRSHFVALALIWGCSFWWVRVSLGWLSPIGVAFVRLLLGSVVLMFASGVARVGLIRHRRTIVHLAVVALLLNALPFTLFAFGQRNVTSVTAGVVNATTPLFALLFGYLVLPQERPNRRQISGLLTGFAGVLVVLEVWRTAPAGTWSGIVLCLLAVCCYGVAFPYARRYIAPLGIQPLSLATVQVSMGALLLLPVAAVIGITKDTGISPDAGEIAAILLLGCLGSGLSYVLSFTIIEHAGSTTASAVTYITPVVAIIVGISFLGEALFWNQLLGAVVIIAGVALTKRDVAPRIARDQTDQPRP